MPGGKRGMRLGPTLRGADGRFANGGGSVALAELASWPSDTKLQQMAAVKQACTEARNDVKLRSKCASAKYGDECDLHARDRLRAL